MLSEQQAIQLYRIWKRCGREHGYVVATLAFLPGLWMGHYLEKTIKQMNQEIAETDQDR